MIKAIALGATAVGIGRLYCYALAAAGRPGIVRMLELLEDEIRRDLGLMGCDRACKPARPVADVFRRITGDYKHEPYSPRRSATTSTIRMSAHCAPSGD